MSGLVYYVLDATRLGMRLKVGTTTSLADRLKSLVSQTASRQVPIVLALEAGGQELEQQRHEQFADQRVHGEWFRPGGDLAEHIAGLPNPVGWLADRPDLWTYAGGWQGFRGWTRTYQPRQFDCAAAPDNGEPVQF